MQRELVDVYYRTQLGFYFQSVDSQPDRVRVSSSMEGIIWNHVYLPQRTPNDAIRSADSDHVYVDGRIARAPEGWTVGDREAWMVRRPDWSPAAVRVSVEPVPAVDARLLDELRHTFDEGHADVMRNQQPSSAITRRHFLAQLPDGSVVGAASLHSLGSWTAIHSVCISKDHRGSGLGHDLMTAVMSLTPPGHKVYLSCDDTWLVDFYRHCGFTVVHRRTGFQR